MPTGCALYPKAGLQPRGGQLSCIGAALRHHQQWLLAGQGKMEHVLFDKAEVSSSLLRHGSGPWQHWLHSSGCVVIDSWAS